MKITKECLKKMVESLPKDVLALVLQYIPRDGTNSRLNVLCVCRLWHDVYLNLVLPPWKMFRIYDEEQENYCGLFGAFNPNDNTVNLSYFYKWYRIAGERFSLKKHGDWLFQQACDLSDKAAKIELVRFFLDEANRRGQQFDISDGADTVMFREDIKVAEIIFTELPYCNLPIAKKVLKKWCTILCHRREMPDDKEERENRVQLVRWIKNRPEMTKYRLQGRDSFIYK